MWVAEYLKRCIGIDVQENKEIEKKVKCCDREWGEEEEESGGWRLGV